MCVGVCVWVWEFCACLCVPANARERERKRKKEKEKENKMEDLGYHHEGGITKGYHEEVSSVIPRDPRTNAASSIDFTWRGTLLKRVSVNPKH